MIPPLSAMHQAEYEQKYGLEPHAVAIGGAPVILLVFPTSLFRPSSIQTLRTLGKACIYEVGKVFSDLVHLNIFSREDYRLVTEQESENIN